MNARSIQLSKGGILTQKIGIFESLPALSHRTSGMAVRQAPAQELNLHFLPLDNTTDIDVFTRNWSYVELTARCVTSKAEYYCL